MNQGRIWCVVSPTVGLPLLLGGVALTSLAVHTAVMTHTTWMSNYWQGSAGVRTTEGSPVDSSAARLAATAPTGQPAFTLSIAPVAGGAGKDAAFLVTVAANPGTATQAATALPPGRTAMNTP